MSAVLVPSKDLLGPLNPARSFQLCFFQTCLFSRNTHNIWEKMYQKTSQHPLESKPSQKWVVLVRKSELNSFLGKKKVQSHSWCLCCFSLGELTGRRDGKLAQVHQDKRDVESRDVELSQQETRGGPKSPRLPPDPSQSPGESLEPPGQAQPIPTTSEQQGQPSIPRISRPPSLERRKLLLFTKAQSEPGRAAWQCHLLAWCCHQGGSRKAKNAPENDSGSHSSEISNPGVE